MAMSRWLRWFASFLHRLTFDSVFVGIVNNKTMYCFCYFLFLADITFLFEKQLTAFNNEESANIA